MTFARGFTTRQFAPSGRTRVDVFRPDGFGGITATAQNETNNSLTNMFRITHRPILAVATLAMALSTQLSTVFAQGSLTPPAGAPMATMKTLDQVEARTAITNTSSLVTISQPGSYYLTGNLTVSTGNGINITTNGVTLDLNGFTIRSTAASATGHAISLAGSLSDLTIRNGHIRGGVTNNGAGVFGGAGFAYGIMYSGNEPQNVLVSHVTVSRCLNHGIFLNLSGGTVVEACTVQTVGGYGISASVIRGCSAVGCWNDALGGSLVSDSYGDSGSHNGIVATIAQNCVGYSGSGTGIFVFKTASGCHGSSNSGTGLAAFIANSCSGSSLSVTHNLNSF